MRLFLIALGIVLAGSAAVGMVVNYGWWTPTLFSPPEPYPTFMTDYQSSPNRSFSEFLVAAFPIGSDAKDAIAQIAGGGFKVTKSNPDSVKLLWSRHAFPCRQEYSIVINPNADGTIAKISGEYNPICL